MKLVSAMGTKNVDCNMILVLESAFDDKIGWCHFCHPPCAPVSTWSNASNHGSQTGNQAQALIKRLNKDRHKDKVDIGGNDKHKYVTQNTPD